MRPARSDSPNGFISPPPLVIRQRTLDLSQLDARLYLDLLTTMRHDYFATLVFDDRDRLRLKRLQDSIEHSLAASLHRRERGRLSQPSKPMVIDQLPARDFLVALRIPGCDDWMR